MTRYKQKKNGKKKKKKKEEPINEPTKQMISHNTSEKLVEPLRRPTWKNEGSYVEFCCIFL